MTQDFFFSDAHTLSLGSGLGLKVYPGIPGGSTTRKKKKKFFFLRCLEVVVVGLERGLIPISFSARCTQRCGGWAAASKETAKFI